MSTFHLFRQLPPELRRSVYLHATPPRVVKIEADIEDWDDFWERWASSTPADMYVHPEIPYFTPFWDRDGAPDRRAFRRQWKTQSTLEAHGFTTQKPRQAHWPLEEQFPFEVILNDKQTVYNLFRRGRLRSSCRIPGLLQTCCESRNVLISAGYELAYGTRTYPATTWFNFKTDILHIQDEDDRRCLCEILFGSKQTDTNETLYGWGDYKPDRPVSQFRLHDLRRIRQLVCARAGPTDDSYYIYYMSRIMPNLRHVYVSLWSDIPSVLSSSSTPPAVLARMPNLHLHQKQHSSFRYSAYQHEYMLRAEDIDMVWASEFNSILSHFGLFPSGDWNLCTWMRWQQERGLEGSFFRFLESHMMGLLQGFLDEARQHALSDSRAIGGYKCPIPEQSPRFQFVALGPIGLVEEIHYNRQAYWQLVQESRESWRQSHSQRQQDGQSSATTTQPPEPAFRLGEFLPNLGEHEASVEWWVLHGKGITQRPKFHLHP